MAGAWFYERTEPHLWTVMCNRSDGGYTSDSDWPSSEEAARRCAYLNGGNVTDYDLLQSIERRLTDVSNKLDTLLEAQLGR